MVTAPKSSGPTGTQLKTGNKNFSLKASDFIKMMVTELQNQDPTQPAKNSELLAQMSQIGSLQSSSDLQESLKGMVLQNQIGSAGTLIGKNVQGLDSQQATVKGVVNSVRVLSNKVYLELDNGKQLELGQVTDIASAANTAKAQTPAAAAA